MPWSSLRARRFNRPTSPDPRSLRFDCQTATGIARESDFHFRYFVMRGLDPRIHQESIFIKAVDRRYIG